LIKPSAAKELEAIGSERDRLRIVERIEALAGNRRPQGVQKLSGAEKYRIRSGDYRIVYSIEDGKLAVYVVKVGHRRDIYP
jgi:mRNA interferase RelE/StbE